MPLKKYVYWIDANLPPKAAKWLMEEFEVNAVHLLSIGMLAASDHEIFKRAKETNDNTIIITRDEDFVNLVLRKKTFPKIIWITVGNLSNDHLKNILLANFEAAVKELHDTDYFFIEIS